MKYEKNKRKIIQRQLWNLMKNDSKIVEELDAVIGVSDDKRYDYFCKWIIAGHVRFYKEVLRKTGKKIPLHRLDKEYRKWQYEDRRLHPEKYVMLAA